MPKEETMQWLVEFWLSYPTWVKIWCLILALIIALLLTFGKTAIPKPHQPITPTKPDAPSGISWDMTPGAIPDGGDAQIVVLGGVIGPFEHGDAGKLLKLIEAKFDGTGGHRKLTVKPWNWAELAPKESIIQLAMESDTNRARAQQLAKELVAWRQRERDGDKPNRTKPLYLVAGSKGADIATFACGNLPEDFRFERILFVSPYANPRRDLSAVLKRQVNGFFCYFSAKDRVIGFNVEAKSRGYAYKRSYDEYLKNYWRLEYQDAHEKYGNGGDHLGCYTTDFCRVFFLDLFDPDAEIPSGWRLFEVPESARRKDPKADKQGTVDRKADEPE